MKSKLVKKIFKFYYEYGAGEKKNLKMHLFIPLYSRQIVIWNQFTTTTYGT